MDQAEKLRDMILVREEKAIKPKTRTSRVITVTSGKGGVGKSNFTVNLAIYFRRLGKQVIIIDADFGLANVELILGITPMYTLEEVLAKERNIREVITEAPMGVRFISGGSGLRELANITEKQMGYLISSFEYLDSIADIILIDTGAGISKSVINFIKASSETIVVTTPEPTSITDAYALIKTIKEEKTATETIPDFKIVVNRTEDKQEGNEIFEKLNRVSNRFLGFRLEYLGAIQYDNNLVKAVKQQKPAAIGYPNTGFCKAVEEISMRLLDDELEIYEKEQKGIATFMKRLTNIFDIRK